MILDLPTITEFGMLKAGTDPPVDEEIEEEITRNQEITKTNANGHQGPHTDNTEEESQDEIAENEEEQNGNHLDTNTDMKDNLYCCKEERFIDLRMESLKVIKLY